jgi:hypothetical protein
MINYLTMGHDCSPAGVLRELHLREFALPFDWIVSNISTIQTCLEDNFNKFHTNLKFNHNKTRLIDAYGFQFPHDYPLINTSIELDELGEGNIGEEAGKHITDNWKEYYTIVKEKYNRRIERFNEIITSKNPVIVLCRYNTVDVLKLQSMFLKYYNKENIYFINSSNDKFENSKIKNIFTEVNNIWNDKMIWKENIDIVKKHIDTTIKPMITILMPIYNGIEFINESVPTIQYQTYKEWELIIGINGYPKGSDVYNIAKKYEVLDNRVKVLDLFEIKGKSEALNEMIKYSNSEWISLLDVDDKWLPNKLESQSYHMTNYDVIGTPCKYFGDLNTSPYIPLGDITSYNFIRGNPIINSSCLVRKELCYWDGSLNLEDYDMWLRLWKQGHKFYNIENIQVLHRIHNDSAFNSKGNNLNVGKLLDKYSVM